jgi:LPS-assembly lipoprotein
MATCSVAAIRLRLPRGLGAWVALLGLALGLVGCGFKLRGEVEIPPDLNPMFIQAGGGSPVAQAIRDRLRGTQVRLAANAKEAKLVLRILSEQRSSRVVAVDRSGKVLSFELHYRLAFDAVGDDGQGRLPRQDIDLVRGFDNPDTEVLGKQLESELIYQDLIDDAADRVLIRLRAALIKSSVKQ